MLDRRSVACALAATALACATRGAQPAQTAAKEVTADAAATLSAAEDALAAGRLPVADDLSRKAVALAPGDDRAHLVRTKVLLATGRWSEAMAEADRALAIREGPQARAARGRALAGERRFDEAAVELERAAAAAPEEAPTLALLAAVHLNRGDRAAVQDAYARLAGAAGRAGAASAMWPALLSVPTDPSQPQESIDRCTRGYVALLDGRPAEAEREGFNGMRFSAEYHWCAVVRAEARWTDGDVAGGERGLRWAIEGYPARLEPLRADAKGMLAELLSADPARAPEAITLARATLAARGERAAVLAALGRACSAARDAACARDAAARLLAQPRVPKALHEEAERWR